MAELGDLQNRAIVRMQSEEAVQLESTLRIVDSIPNVWSGSARKRALAAGDTTKSDAIWDAAVNLDEMFARLPQQQGKDPATARPRLEHAAKVIGGVVPAATEVIPVCWTAWRLA
ncbi:MAG: hypothetical protein OXC25_06400 [Thiotrichales bacterium]|nr:hypothetical protein [Thiotrichales bacterium]